MASYLAEGYKSRDALSHYVAALAIYREVGARLGEANTLDSLGNQAFADENYTQAIAYRLQGLAIVQAIGDRYSEAAFLYYLSQAKAKLGKTVEAIDHLQQAAIIFEQIALPDLANFCRQAISALSSESS